MVLKYNAIPDLLLAESATEKKSLQTSHREGTTDTTCEEDVASAEDTAQTAFSDATPNEVC